MKKAGFYILAIIGLISCNDSFMERYPETSIAPEVFFKTTTDLELYTNTYYEYIQPVAYRTSSGASVHSLDVSDNFGIYSDRSDIMDLMRGNTTPETVGGWNNWGELRRFNFFLQHAQDASGDVDVINHHIGITRLMRATWYYNMVKRYNDVPWYSAPLSDKDEEMLYKGKDSRTVVVDSIMADLEYAVNHILPDMGNKTRINKWYAYACMARICLHEGTFRKYHDEQNLQSTADAFLMKAKEAALKIMNSGLFQIDMTGGPDKAYQNLFINENLSASSEIILMVDFNLEKNITHGAFHNFFDYVYGLSRSLMESYQVLTPEGNAVPFSSIAGYETKNVVDVFEDRDPRFKQTFMYPGYKMPGQSNEYRSNLNFGGYPQIKFCQQKVGIGEESNYTDLPICRIAEIYLIFAEAKAELGELTQEDLDQSVNLIRSRVNMPPTILNNIVTDMSLINEFPNVTGNNRNVILEIRRERRVELACEGFRTDDLYRWKAGYLLQRPQQGVYIDSLGLHDFTGDGIPDIGIFENVNSNTVPDEERNKYSFYYLKNVAGAPTSIYLSNGNSGYIMSTGDRDGVRDFKEPQYYYFPIPQTQRVLNPNLEQTIFW